MGTTCVGVNPPQGKKLPQYPCIQATVNTNAADFYVVNTDWLSESQFNVIFNRPNNGAFILAVSYDVIDA